MEEVRSQILEILQELHEDVDFERETKLVADKVLDSFDLITLVTELGDAFEIEITARDFVEENFNSLEALTAMVVRLMDE